MAYSEHERRLTSLVEAHGALVTWLLRHWGVCAADSDDAAQQVFLTLNRKLETVPRGKERAFIAGCSINVALRVRRNRARRRELSGELIWDLSDAAANPELTAERRQRAAESRALLQRMDAELRIVFVRHDIEGLTMAELARALAIPPGTVASRLRRARGWLKAVLARSGRTTSLSPKS